MRSRERGQAQESPSGVGHSQPVGDALEHLQLLDLRQPPHNLTDLALIQAAGDADLGLTGLRALVEQLEELPHLTAAQSRDDLGSLPERVRDLDQVEGPAGHAVVVPPASAQTPER